MLAGPQKIPCGLKSPQESPTGPPLEVRATAQSSTRIRVTFKKPKAWKRNGPLAGYSVVYNPLNHRGLLLVKNITNPKQTRTILTGLKMFTEYEIRVRALGQIGPGPFSRPVVVETKEGGRYLTYLMKQYKTKALDFNLLCFLKRNSGKAERLATA